MKNKLLDDYIQALWQQHKSNPMPPLEIRNAAIKQAHIERSMAFVQFKTDLGRWFKSIFNTDPTCCCDESQCSI